VTIDSHHGVVASPRPRSFSREGLIAGAAVLLLLGGVALHVTLLVNSWHRATLGLDFTGAYLPAAEAILDGESPFPHGDEEVGSGFGYVYPPLVAFLSIPFTLLPGGVDVVITLLMLACVPASLWLLGVRDWRCYAVTALWAPVFHATQTANVTLPILLGASAAWHYRASAWRTGVVGGLTLAAKLLAWPLVVWLAAVRRVRAAVLVVLIGALVTFGLWAVIGFAGLADFRATLDRFAELEGPAGYSTRTLLVELGLPGVLASALSACLVAGFLVGVVVYGLRSDDARSFACATTVMVFTSPVVWLHSFALLLAPVAVLRPRLSWIWFLPALLWWHTGNGNGPLLHTALTVGVCVGLVLAALWAPSGQTGRSTTTSRSSL
jgi:hypothetical protein